MAQAEKKEIFLVSNASLGILINDKSNELFVALKNLDCSPLDKSDQYIDYFLNHHLNERLFFSIQNSAHILYGAVKQSGKPLHEISAIDYGAGLGTLFMLGGMLGFKRFDYNDHLPEWQSTARAVCQQAGSCINDFVTGDINAVTAFANTNQFTYDIIVSRNVIEHIYSLSEFYSTIFKHNPRAVVYSTTTANFHNPVMRLYHIYIHRKTEKQYYRQQRLEEVKKLNPLLQADQLNKLAIQTRGKGQKDFIDAVRNYANGNLIQKDSSLRSNTCDCINGVWCEHLLTKKEYEKIIGGAGFKMNYTAGYWDTHYSNGLLNVLAKLLNRIILLWGNKKGVTVSPFVNVTAYN
jgi:2-polyprenyl-3-methyl-5-hydroxy-6-metoxy-1,4-benzoquinol methylase